MRKRVWFIILCALFVTLSLSGCEEESNEDIQDPVAELTQQINSLQEENETLSVQLEECQGRLETSDSEFLSIYFWSDGTRYQSKDELTFYSDCFCSEAASPKLVFISANTAKVPMKNGLTVYASMSNQGVVWSTSEPRFEPLESNSWPFSWNNHHLLF